MTTTRKPTHIRPPSRWMEFRAHGGLGSLGVAFTFFVVTTGILMLRKDVIPYRPGQYVQHNITSRVDFDFPDADQLARLQNRARETEPNVYRATAADYWGALQDELLTLPDRTLHDKPAELPPDLANHLDASDLAALELAHDHERAKYDQSVRRFVEKVRQQLTAGTAGLVILPSLQRQQELLRSAPSDQTFVRYVTIDPAKQDPTQAPDPKAIERKANVESETYGTDLPPEVLTQLRSLAEVFPTALQPPIARLTYEFLQNHATHSLDLAATKAAQDRAAQDVPPSDASEHYPHDTVIVPKGEITERDWQVLAAENQAFMATQEAGLPKELSGTALVALSLTAILAAYISRYQPRVVRNHLRGAALGALILAMLLISALAGVGSGSLYYFGVAPTVLTAIILTIAYDQRFAIGVASWEAMLATIALDQDVNFFLILLVGVLVAVFMLDDVRTRSKLVEIGGASALAMMALTAATGLTSLESSHVVAHNALYAGAAGLTAGFVTLGILPFIEKIFHITTSMTLLELADVTQPLLKRLAIEAPGTYNHSLQVATLAAAAAEAIGANALACRVGAYYHDIGKLNKADYFAENQLTGAPSRHWNLSPSVSLLIIIGHVKDGMELAREYNLPPTILQFIQQHHGTTLVEFFYKEACRLTDPNASTVSETQYRYPGPKPKSRETAILMLCDCVESAVRAMPQPNPTRMESLVNELAMRRLQDGQFDECDLTMRDLERISRSLIKTLLGIYHGRLAYPSMTGPQPPTPPVRKLA